MSENNSNNIPRKRGAQSGNTNALKHGFYSKRLNALTEKALTSINTGNVQEEIHLIRTMIARHLAMRTTNPAASTEESLADLRVISFAVARIASLMRLTKNIPADFQDSEDWMDDLLGDALAEFPNDPNDLLQ